MNGRRSSIVMAALAALVSGCGTSRIHFQDPVGARLFIAPSGVETQGKEYTLPVTLDLRQMQNATAVKSNMGGRPIRMVLPDGTRLKGFLYVYRLYMDEVERLAEITFDLSEEQIAKLKHGHAVTVVGYSASRRPVYKVNLGLDRK